MWLPAEFRSYFHNKMQGNMKIEELKNESESDQQSGESRQVRGAHLLRLFSKYPRTPPIPVLSLHKSFIHPLYKWTFIFWRLRPPTETYQQISSTRNKWRPPFRHGIRNIPASIILLKWRLSVNYMSVISTLMFLKASFTQRQTESRYDINHTCEIRRYIESHNSR